MGRPERSLAATLNRNHLKMMSDDLKDIQGIMTKNIQEVLGRGEKLESTLVTPASSQALNLSVFRPRPFIQSVPMLRCLVSSIADSCNAFLAAVTNKSSTLSAETKRFKEKATSLVRIYPT